ncbi:MAG: type II toxin-antitoxin system RelE/ParE family toxin [Eggerthellaceae bacterium]|nr:type II toxin-antitoxin system RelE/ParE family toxin [Eggerthellaceae bacterium]
MTGARFELAFIDRAAQKEYLSLDGSVRKLVDKGLARLAARGDEIGKPLSGDLAGCRELKFRAEGLRVIYRIANGAVEVVEIIAIGHRGGGEVFGTASRRIG